jgi:hypothetical protein
MPPAIPFMIHLSPSPFPVANTGALCPHMIAPAQPMLDQSTDGRGKSILLNGLIKIFQ